MRRKRVKEGGTVILLRRPLHWSRAMLGVLVAVKVIVAIIIIVAVKVIVAVVFIVAVKVVEGAQ